ncbi:hypothetical protein AAE478_002950 [Parahypoxylon ruwenzoriense]
MAATRADLGLSCPSKGKFYVCESATIRFVGCCTVDPCADGSGKCPQSALAPASFSSDHYDSIPPQSCAAPSNSNRWFTCKGSSQPFMGCCSAPINPCQNEGCPTANLLAATLSDNADDAQVFLATSESSTPTPTPNPSGSSGSSLSLGAILGIALGCTALIAILLVILAYRCGWLARHKKHVKEIDEASKHHIAPGPYSPGMTQWHDGSQAGSSPFPSPGFAPYSPNQVQFLHPQQSPPPTDSWHADSRHVSQVSELSGWSAVADQKQSHTPLLAPTATELEGRDTERPMIAELPSSPATNHHRQ